MQNVSHNICLVIGGESEVVAYLMASV